MRSDRRSRGNARHSLNDADAEPKLPGDPLDAFPLRPEALYCVGCWPEQRVKLIELLLSLSYLSTIVGLAATVGLAPGQLPASDEHRHVSTGQEWRHGASAPRLNITPPLAPCTSPGDADWLGDRPAGGAASSPGDLRQCPRTNPAVAAQPLAGPTEDFVAGPRSRTSGRAHRRRTPPVAPVSGTPALQQDSTRPTAAIESGPDGFARVPESVAAMLVSVSAQGVVAARGKREHVVDDRSDIVIVQILQSVLDDVGHQSHRRGVRVTLELTRGEIVREFGTGPVPDSRFDVRRDVRDLLTIRPVGRPRQPSGNR